MPIRSDKSDRSSSGGSGKLKPGLGTPKALSLSAASSLSNSSTSSAKLIQSSHPPATYHPQPPVVQASSPIWKPRENSYEKAPTKEEGASSSKQYFVYDEYGSALYVIPPTVPKKESSQQPTNTMSSKQSDC